MIQINLDPRPKNRKRQAAYLATLVFIALLAGTLSHAEAAIIDGNSVKGEYPGVFAIKMSLPAPVGSGSDEPTEGLCTAFLVQPRLLLTAAHCIHTANSITHVTNDASVRSSAPSGASQSDSWVQDFRANPGYFSTSQSDAVEVKQRASRADIGYVVLSQDVNGVTPFEVEAVDNEEARTSFAGQIALLVGYGANVWNSSGIYDGSMAGTKRMGQKRITSAANGLFYLKGASHGVLPGDSGGPLLVTIGGKLKVVAINQEKSDATAVIQKKKFLSKKTRAVVVRTNYDESIESPLTTENLCWVVNNSGIAIPGVSCDAATAAK